MIDDIEELNEMIYHFQEEALLSENAKIIKQLARNGVKIRVQQNMVEAS